MKIFHLRIEKTSEGGPRGSNPRSNPWLVSFKKGDDDDWHALGRWPTKIEAEKQASRMAHRARREGFHVQYKGHRLSPI